MSALTQLVVVAKIILVSVFQSWLRCQHWGSKTLKYGVLCVTLSSMFSHAAIEDIESWKPWVEAKHPHLSCAYHGASLDRRLCAWPGVLAFQLNDQGGSFSQTWEINGDAQLQLPGDGQHWPLNVEVDGKAASVVKNNNRPTLYLRKGSYTISGEFLWEKIPQRLQIPAQTGLVRFTINGKAVPLPHIEANGVVWLQKKAEPEKSERNSAKVEVFRALIDGVPMRIKTTLKISVSGDARELTTGALLLPNAITESFDSQLPAKMDRDGALRIQIRSGQWQVHHSARVNGNIGEFSIKSDDALWPEQEIWGFKSAPDIRQVRIVGPSLLDSTQIDLTDNIRDLPLYLMNLKTQMVLQQQDARPRQQTNKLTLERTIWLDFSGNGATVKDVMTGNIYQGSRLDTLASLHLGNVRMSGKAHVITRLNKDSEPGVEIRDPTIALEALSRIDHRKEINASNWDTDFDKVSASLMLPPGWRVWHIAGPDSVRSSWVSDWTLWDIFLCLIIVGAIYKLMGISWAIVAFLTGVLTYHTHSAIFVYLFPFVIIIPLLRVLPLGKTRRSLSVVCSVIIVVVGLSLIQFTIQQLRTAIYPQLEYAGNIVKPPQRTKRSDLKVRGAMPTDVQRQGRTQRQSDDAFEDSFAPESERNIAESLSKVTGVQVTDGEGFFDESPGLNAKEKTQTGPASPTWRWRTVNYSWTGPVKKEDESTLYLSGPTLSRMLNVIEALLSIALFLGISITAIRKMAFGKMDEGAKVAMPVSIIVISMLFSLSLLSTSTTFAQHFPPEYLLKEYESRLTQNPVCSPQCFAVNQMNMSIKNDVLAMQIDVSSQAHISFALPISQQWQPNRISINGKTNDKVKKVGRFYYLPLQTGAHTVELRGKLVGSTISLEFANDIYNVTVNMDGWRVRGIVDNAIVGRTVSFERDKKTEVVNSLVPDTAAPFVSVERALTLDTDWSIRTTVIRKAPRLGPITLEIPLLPGEDVLTEGAQIANNMITVNLGSRESHTSWRSTMEPVEQLQLISPASPSWVEIWSIAPSERWHIEYSGIEPISRDDVQLTYKVWKPWPEQRLLLNITKPDPIAGSAHTVQSVKMRLKPGKRIATVSSTVSITSSTGGDYTLTLPDNAITKEFVVNGETYNNYADQRTLLASLKPGRNTIRIGWQIEKGVSLLTTTPQLALQTPANNISLMIDVPRDRWPLFVMGPHVGPAMLFWGVLCFILIFACMLGYAVRRWRLSIPLNTWHWILLGLGVSTINTYAGFLVVLWFAALEARNRYADKIRENVFNGVQIGIAILTVIALCTLLFTIPLSLLSSPNMHITGNGSSAFFLSWYADHGNVSLPNASIVSVSIWYFRLAMLLWSIWLVFALIRWAKWSWGAFTRRELWVNTKRSPK